MKEANKSFEVEAVFIQKPEVLYPNLSLEANIIIQEVENALSLPKKAILPGNRILLSTGDTAQITLGAQSMEWVQVLKGIEESDKIIQP
jgi:multidrug efflux pump subunit AcrA (membrane-fusion protein)